MMHMTGTLPSAQPGTCSKYQGLRAIEGIVYMVKTARRSKDVMSPIGRCKAKYMGCEVQQMYGALQFAWFAV